MGKNILKYSKKAFLTILFPLIMFLVMFIITKANGIDYYVGNSLFRNVLIKGSLGTILALAIFSQFRNGRFDFSGGATLVLSSIIAGQLATRANYNYFVYFGLCFAIAIALSMVTATAYIYARVPIIIITIAMTLVYESFTYMLFGATGLNIISSKLAFFCRIPGVFIPLAIAMAAFVIFTYFTVDGKRAHMLACNQKVTVFIGVREKRSVYSTYLVTGIILGCGAAVYGVIDRVSPQAGLSTSGVLFSYIVPVFIGLFLGAASFDFIGILMAAIGMQFLNYGLSCLGYGGGGVQQIIMGVFMLAIYTLSSQMNNIKKLFAKLKKKKADPVSEN